MKNFLQNIFENHLNGSYFIKVGAKYISFPRLAPVMTAGMITTGLGGYNNVVGIIGITTLVIGLIGFFYYNIFPSRLPKSKND